MEKPGNKKIAIITSHPIQYNAPLFKELAKRPGIELKVFYTWGQAKRDVFDPGFKTQRSWDIPLLDGYEYEFVQNISATPGSHSFNGIDNPGLIKSVILYRPDVILIFGWSFKSHLKVLRYFKGKVKIVFRGDSTLLDEPANFSLKKILRRLFLKWVYAHIDVALYAGTANKAYFLTHGIKESQLFFAPHAIENSRFYPTAAIVSKAARLRSEKLIKETDIVFLFAGKLEPKKDPALLIRAFKMISPGNAHLLIVGDGELKEELVNISSENANIHFLGFQNQSQMTVMYALADVFVLPSKGPGETWGLAVNEAMASGKAVLVSDRCGCAVDLVKEGKNGYLFRNSNMDDLLNKMKLMLSKQTCAQMGSQSLTAISSWSMQAICQAIERAIA